MFNKQLIRSANWISLWLASVPLGQGQRTFFRTRVQIVYKSRRNSFEYPWEFWRVNTVLDSSKIIINYCINIIVIIINAFYNYFKGYLLYYISIKPSSNVMRKKEIRSNCRCYNFLLEKKTVKLFVQCHIFAQSRAGRYPNDKYPANTSHGSDLCKNVSLAVLFGSNDSSYTVFTQMCVCIHIYIMCVCVCVCVCVWCVLMRQKHLQAKIMAMRDTSQWPFSCCAEMGFSTRFNLE